MHKIWIIGGANIDICGASVNKLVEYDSNIGKVEITSGGVARNIAQVATLLGSNVEFVTCFSDDYFGKILKSECEELGISCGHSIFSSNYPTSIYLAILNEKKDMQIGMSDMRILSEIDRVHLKEVLTMIDKDDLLVMDSNMKEELISFVVENCPCKIASDPVSANKINRLSAFLNHISIFKPNHYEAKEITGIEIKDKATAIESLKWFLDRGVEEIIITMSDYGALLGTNTGCFKITHRPSVLKNATGGGDAFLGAYISERMSGLEPVKAIEIAIATAVYTVESDYKERAKLNKDLLFATMENLNINIEKLA